MTDGFDIFRKMASPRSNEPNKPTYSGGSAATFRRNRVNDTVSMECSGSEVP